MFFYSDLLEYYGLNKLVSMFHLLLPSLYDFSSLKGKMESSSYKPLALYAKCIGCTENKSIICVARPFYEMVYATKEMFEFLRPTKNKVKCTSLRGSWQITSSGKKEKNNKNNKNQKAEPRKPGKH